MIPHVNLDGLADYQRRRDGLRGAARAGILILALFAAMLAHDCGNIAEAEDAPAALALARVCAGEAPMGALGECTAIAEVLARRSTTGAVTPSIARAYSAALRPHNRHVRPWLFELDASGERPASWPEGPSWRVWRPRWMALLDHARGLVTEGGRVCSAPPDHWGGPMDSHRAHRAGWIPVDCGRTRNHFWRVPGR